MTYETRVQLTLDSASLFQALQAEVGEWRLQDHVFDPATDEVRVSYDSAGSGRIAITVGFELTETQMARLLQEARPASRADPNPS